MSEVGSITVKIGADTYELQKGVATAKKEIDGLGERGKALEGVLQGLATVAIATAGAVTVLAKNAIDTADNLNKMSQKIGIAVEDLSRLAYAAQLSDVDIGSLQQSLVFLSRNMSAASTGSGDAYNAFNALNVAFKNTDGSLRSQAEVLGDVADRFANMRDGAEKTALAMAIFGRAGAQMIPMLNMGRDGLKGMGDELERFGGLVSGSFARSAEQFNDNLTRLKTILGGLTMQTFAPLIEGLNASFEAFLKTEKAAKGFMSFMGSFSLSGMDMKDPNLALAQTESTIAGVRRNIEALNKYPVLNADDLIIANKQLEFLEAKSRAIQGVLATNVTPQDQSQLPKGPTLGNAEEAQKQQDKDNAFKVEQAKKLQLMLEGFMSERQLEQERFRQQLDDLAIMREALGISALDHQLYVESLEQQHWERMNEIQKKGLSESEKFKQQSYLKQAKDITSFLAQMTAATANSSKEMFMLNKAVALADGIVTAYKTVMDAYAFGTKVGGPAAGAAFAAVAGAAQFATLANIASSQYQGKSTSAPTGIGQTAAGAIPVQQVNSGGQAVGGGAGQVVNISLTGNTFNRDQVRDLISNINEVISDGSTIRLQ